MKKNTDICPAEHAHMLDLKIRNLVHNPDRILSPYVNKGMSVLDLGCGPGFFTLTLSKLVGSEGQVVAADLQDEMLTIVKNKIANTEYEKIVKFHNAQKDSIGLNETFDFILVFYMLHEVPNQANFLKELYDILKNNGQILISEPKFHVSKKDFNASLDIMEKIGFIVSEKPSIFLSRSVILKKK